MPEPRSVMKEFRSLDQRRSAGRLTSEEEARYAYLRDLIGPEMSAGPLRPGFDVDSATAQLRDSLLPAGLRNRPPPVPTMAEPEPEAADESVPAAEPAPLEAPQQQDAFFDPSWLSPDAAASEAQQAWDSNAQYDPAAASYDPNATYDPNAAYDPNAQAEWDPNLPYDAGAPEAAAQGDEPAEQASGEAAQAQDAVEQPYGEAEQPYDTTTQQPPAEDDRTYDAVAQPYGGAEQPYDMATQRPPGEAGQPYEAAPVGGDAQPPDAATAQQAGASWDPDAPFDPNAFALPPSPTGQPGAFPDAGTQAYRQDVEPPAETDPLAEPAAQAGAPPEEPELPEGWFAEGPQGTEAAPEGADAGLESMLPFDPAAASAVAPGETPDGFGARAGEYDDTAGFDARRAETAPVDLSLEEPAFEATRSMEREAAQDLPAENVLDDGFDRASGGSFDATADAAAPEWAGGTVSPPWEPGPIDDGPVTPSAAPFDTPVAPDRLSGDLDDGIEAAPPGQRPALDFSQPDFSHGGSPDDDAAFLDTLLAPSPAAPLTSSAGSTGKRGLPSLDRGAPPELTLEEPTATEEDIPTIDGEEILEEIPAEPVEAGDDSGCRVPGSHRVVVHTLEGKAKRGVLADADLASGTLELAPQPGAAPEVLPSQKLKAIFFMLGPGEKAPAPHGKKLRVTFRDGRQVAGFSPDYRETGPGFFMIPSDSTGNTGRVWVYRSAVRDVSVG